MATDQVSKFNAKDSVLCYHGPLIYRARVLDAKPSQESPDEFVYRVHYEGWKSKWDEWVTEDRMLEINEANLKLQKELLEAESSQKKKRKSVGMTLKDRAAASSSADGGKQVSSRTSSTDYEPKRKKAHMQQKAEAQAQFCGKLELKVIMPDDLKSLLVDDWNFVIKQRKLIKLPASRTVRQILADYVKFKGTVKGIGAQKLGHFEEAAHGLGAYFDVMLGTQLLYKFERLQYSDLVAQHGDAARMSNFYGFSHLLRLFVRLGNMMIHKQLGEENVKLIMPFLQDIVAYLQQQQATLFAVDDYFTASAEYKRASFA